MKKTMTTMSDAIANRRKAAKALLLGGVAVFALADAAAAADAAVGSETQVQDVVVTARKRSESLQKVPVAVTVVNGTVARQENRNDISDLVQTIPTVEFRAQPSNKDQDVLIRGLGTITTSAGAEPTVSTVVDGVVLARPGQMVSDFIDLNHIEVLNGPQGTLFGKNASAGVINIVTNNPTPKPGGYAEASYYEGNEYRFSGVVNGELIKDVLSARVAAVTSDFKGNETNVVNGATVNGYNTSGVRAKLLYTPSADLSILFGYDYMYSTDTYNALDYLGTYNISYPSGKETSSANLARALSAEGVSPSFSNTDVAYSGPQSDIDLTTGAFLQADYSIGGYTLTSITAYRYWRNVQTGDTSGFAALSALTPTFEEDLGHVRLNQYSEELRLSSPKGGFLDYVVGAYYFHAPDVETYQRTTSQLSATKTTVNEGINNFGATPTDYALFGESNLNFTRNFRAIAGLRLIHDDLSFYTDRVSTNTVAVPGINPSVSARGSDHVNDYSARLGLQYDLTDSINTYFTYSRGYKGPAYNVFFNQTALQTNALLPETSNDFEIGIKSKLFDNRLQLNIDAWDDDVSNYQANEPALVDGTVITDLINAGDVNTRGVQFDGTYRVDDKMTLSTNFAYTDARIVSFNCPVGAPVSCNVNGKPLPFAPKVKFILQADYIAFSTERFDVGLKSDYEYQTSEQDSIAETPDTIAPAYGIWNGSISLTDKSAAWNARFIVRNILDQHYYTSIAEGNGGLLGIVPRDFSRYVGVAIHKDF